MLHSETGKLSEKENVEYEINSITLKAQKINVKYEKLEKYLSHCTPQRAITSTCCFPQFYLFENLLTQLIRNFLIPNLNISFD